MSWLLLVSIETRCYLAVVQPLCSATTGRGAGLRGRKDWSAVAGLNDPDYLLFVYLGQILHDCLPLSPSWYTKEKGQELGSAGRVQGRSWFSGKGQSAFCRSVFGKMTGLTCSSHECLVCLWHIHTHYPGSGCNTYRIRPESWTRDFLKSGCEWMMSCFSSAWLLDPGLFRVY